MKTNKEKYHSSESIQSLDSFDPFNRFNRYIHSSVFFIGRVRRVKVPLLTRPIAQEISTVGEQIAEVLKVGMYKQAVTMCLQLLKSMANHFVEDEHYCYFDDMYSPEYALKWIYEEINKYKIDEESQVLLDIGHSEIMDSECYQEYGYPSYL